MDSFDDAPKKMPKAVKWLAGTAIGLVLVAGVGGVIATQIVDQDYYKDMIVAKVRESTGYTVDWQGDISLGLLPLPHATVKDLSVKSGDVRVLSIAKADIRVALLPLLSKRVDIEAVELKEPVVTLETSKDGQKLWLAKKPPAKEDTASVAAHPDNGQGFDVSVERISISNGAFIVDDKKSGSKQEFSHLNLSLRADSLHGPFDVNADTVWAGQKIQAQITSGEVSGEEDSYPIQVRVTMPDLGVSAGFTGTVDANKTIAKGEVNVSADDILSAAKGLAGHDVALPNGLAGKAVLAGKFTYAPNRMSLDDAALLLGTLSSLGQFSVDGLGGDGTPQIAFNMEPRSSDQSANDPVMGMLSSLAMSFKGSVEHDGIQIASAQLKMPGNDVSLHGYVTTGASPKIDLDVQSNELNFDSLQKTDGGTAGDVKPAGSAPQAGVPVQGITLPFDGKIKANVKKLTTGQKVYSDIQADIESHDGGLLISQASLRLPDGSAISAKGKIGNTELLSGIDMTAAVDTGNVEKLMTSYGVAPPAFSKKLGATTVRAQVTGDTKTIAFNAVVNAMQFAVTGIGAVADPMGTPVINTLKFDIKHPNFNDALRVLQPGFSGADGSTGPIDVSGQVAWSDNQYQVTNLNGKLGATTVSGNMSATLDQKISLSGALDFGNIFLPSSSAAGKAAVSGTGGGGSPANQGHWSNEAIDMAWMKSIDADLKIKAKSITQNLWKLTDANFVFNLKNGVLKIDDVSAGLFGGQAKMSGVIKAGAGDKDPLTMTATLNAHNVDAQGLMSAATGKISHTLTGTLSGVDVAVNATGLSTSALVQTLAGKGTASGKNIVVQGVDAAQLAQAAKGSFKPVERAGSFLGSFGDGSTEFTDFNSEFVIQSGIVNFSKIYFDGPKATLNSTGNVNLPAWTVELKNTMTVKNTDMQPFDFTIKGPLDGPSKNGGDVLNDYFRSKVEKKVNTLIENKLGKVLGTHGASNGSSTSTKGAAAQDAVNALQGLLGK
jgi:uncharacterized protein involved in outer membrane biogenesis